MATWTLHRLREDTADCRRRGTYWESVGGTRYAVLVETSLMSDGRHFQRWKAGPMPVVLPPEEWTITPMKVGYEP